MPEESKQGLGKLQQALSCDQDRKQKQVKKKKKKKASRYERTEDEGFRIKDILSAFSSYDAPCFLDQLYTGLPFLWLLVIPRMPLEL